MVKEIVSGEMQPLQSPIRVDARMEWTKKVLGWAYLHSGDVLREKIVKPRLPIPIMDSDAYWLYPRYHWMFNKLLLCEAQGLPAYPHGIQPSDVGIDFPVFSKPIINLWGLSTGAKRLDDWQLSTYIPGHFWMPLLPEPQFSTDAIIRHGNVEWTYSMRPIFDGNGSFTRWETADLPSETADTIAVWAERHLSDFVGVANFETRGRWIIEAPPRMASQFIGFYGEGWLDRVIKLYRDGTWEAPERVAKIGYSYVVRVDRSYADRHLRLRDRQQLVQLEEETGTSVVLPWPDGQRLGVNNEDEYSFRIAVVSGWDLAVIEEMARELIGCIEGLEV